MIPGGRQWSSRRSSARPGAPRTANQAICEWTSIQPWSPFRRKWAMERKGLELRDVAYAGGWKDPTTLLKVYQQPDPETLERVVSERRKLRKA